MTGNWIRVFAGNIAQARIAESVLQEHGIPARALSATPGYLDAASMGTATLAETVYVPPDRANEAAQLLHAQETRPRAEGESQHDRLRWLATRVAFATLWSAFAVPVVPSLLGLWWGARYLREAGTVDPRPEHVPLVITLMALCVLTLPIGLLLIRMVVLAV